VEKIPLLSTFKRMARVSGKQDQEGEQHLVRLGKVIRAHRDAQNMSQEALADAAGLDRTHMGRIERGERNLTLLNLIRVAAAMNLKSSELLAAAAL